MHKLAYLGLLLMSTSAWAYQITLTEPEAERAYHRAVQDIEVVANVKPALSNGATVAIFLNDDLVADGTTATIKTTHLLAGEYTLKAIVMDKNAKTIAQDSQTIYIIQNAPYVRQKRNAIKEREAYEALPWHKKLAIGVNPKVQAPPKVTEETPIRQVQQLMQK